MTEPANEPRDKRNSVFLYAAVGLTDGVVERRVRNLSEHGVCIDHGGDLVAGMTVPLAMGSLTALTGTVMWVSSKLAGLRFAETIDLDAARVPRSAASRIVPSAGWMNDLSHAYRKTR